LGCGHFLDELLNRGLARTALPAPATFDYA
jgi:hypothetical protein